MKHSKRRYSLAIENILKECQDLQNPVKEKLSKYLETQINGINSAYDQIKNTDLNPIKFEASRAYQNGKKRLNAYLEEKNKTSKVMNKEKLKHLLIEEPFKPTQNKLSFNSFHDHELSHLILKNKRKFGEGWGLKGFSYQTSPLNSTLPSVPGSKNMSPVQMKNTNLNTMITTLINKKLGLLPKPSLKKIKKKKQKIVIVKEPSSENVDKLEDQQEEQYLSPEYKQYYSNVSSQLRIQRLVVDKHVRDRKSIIMNLIN